MTQNQINYLYEQIPQEWKSARMDFGYYKSLKEYNGQFIMVIADWTVSVCKISVKDMLAALDEESGRYRMIYSRDNFDNGLCYHIRNDNGKYKYIWYDGANGFHTISKDKALTLWRNFITPWHEMVIERYSDEVDILNNGLDIDVVCEDFFNEQMEFSKKNGGNLQEMLDRLKNWARHATNHKIMISRDFDRSFLFCELINNKPATNGGIVFYNGKWSIHT